MLIGHVMVIVANMQSRGHDLQTVPKQRV